MNILGISCFYHDSAACLVQDGVIIAAAQEERFTRKKHDHDFPIKAINYCLSEGKIKAENIDYVVFYEKPFLKFERILETALAYVPWGLAQFLQAIPIWLKQKLWMPSIIEKELGYKGKILFCGHHEAHAASAFYASPFDEAAFLTLDGVGEWETVSFGTGIGNSLNLQYSLHFPHSLGLLYSAFTYYCGFKVNSGEYKLMGLAPYGEPKYVDLILDKLVDLKDDGSFKMNMKYFGYGSSLRMTNRNFHRLFKKGPRRPESKITQLDMDIAASIQKVTEEIILRICRHVHQVTNKDKLCLAGGVALNCVGNGMILREGPFKEIWVQPASGDAGAALGAALLVWYKYLGNERVSDDKNDRQKASLLGPEYSDKYIEQFLSNKQIPYEKLEKQELPEKIAELISKGKVIGWFNGRMEFGPRALGARSFLGDARDPQMQSKMNLKIKYRESFRPFAPSVLTQEAKNWFELGCESPYMLIVAQVKKDKLIDTKHCIGHVNGLERLNVRRSLISAVTHIDNSARVQTVKREDNPVYYDTINAYFRKTGCPVIINSSFNVRGEPLVCSPEDAFRCFMRTEADYLVLGSYLIDKRRQNAIDDNLAWKKEFQLD